MVLGRWEREGESEVEGGRTLTKGGRKQRGEGGRGGRRKRKGDSELFPLGKLLLNILSYCFATGLSTVVEGVGERT